MKRDSAQLKGRMSGHWLSAFSTLAPCLDQASQRLGRNVSCPVNGGTDGFRLFNDANETGGGVKQALGVFPQGIDLLMWVNDWNYVQTYDSLRDWLGGDFRSKPQPTRVLPSVPTLSIEEESKRRSWLNSVWIESLSLACPESEPAMRYFTNRCINFSALFSRDIRFHPSLSYVNYDTGEFVGRFAAIVSLVRNNDGRPVTLHRTYLSDDGFKLELGNDLDCRKMCPPVDRTIPGRHIRLYEPINNTIGICEGIETAMSVYEATGIPVWPCISASMMQSFSPPAGITKVLNFIDKDRNDAAQHSADILREKFSHDDCQLIDLLPPTPILSSDVKGVDWADQLLRDVSGFVLAKNHFDSQVI